MHGAGGCVEGVFDPLADGVFLAVGAVQVDLMQDADAGPRPGGDFGGLAGGIEPKGQGGVPQVIRAAGSGVAASSGLSAAWRAACQARP